MRIVAGLPEIGLEYLGPNVDDPTAALRAHQLSYFMRHEVHGPVYEEEFGLAFIDTDPPSGTPEDEPWRVASMRENHTVLPDGSYREYVIAGRLTHDEQISAEESAIVGLVVATKPQLCTSERHQPSHLAEIDVARSLRGKGLAVQLLRMLREIHPEDPYIDLETYEGNVRSQNFHRKLGFKIDHETPPRSGEVYDGNWIRMHAASSTFCERLSTLPGK